MRTATISRKTKETDITVRLTLDGSGSCNINTGIGFFDHMLTAFAVHGGMNLDVMASGDLPVDTHHTVEDTGIVLGQALAQALGDKSGIARYGSFFLPMDEALAFCCLDISGRPYLAFDCPFSVERIGTMETETVVEFWRAFATHARITLHLRREAGFNNHHVCEALFKAAGHALRLAVQRTGGSLPLSTKGVL